MANIVGTESGDLITGTGFDDKLEGLGGSDIVYGGSGNDTLDGGDGADRLLGEAGNDTLLGGLGNDSLDGGTGADIMDGGFGNDTYTVDNIGDQVSESIFSSGSADKVRTYITYKLHTSIENLDLLGSAHINGTGNDFNNIIRGNTGNNEIDGLDGNDTIYGGSGSDILNGGMGNDTLYGDSGSDTINGGAGNDKLYGGTSSDVLDGGSGNDELNGQADGDTMMGGLGDDTYYVDNVSDVVVETSAEGGADKVVSTITYSLGLNIENLTLSVGTSTTQTYHIDGTGNVSANKITGNNFNNILSGLAGNDTLTGGAGNDTLNAGDGFDTLIGGIGDDILIGGADPDVMTGGDGNDIFVFEKLTDSTAFYTGRDQILDFAFGGVKGLDLIDLSRIDAIVSHTDDTDDAFKFIGAAPFSAAGQVRYDQGLLQLEVNGDGIRDMWIYVPNATLLTEASFIL